MHHPTDRIAHTMAFVAPVVEYWLEQEIAQWGGGGVLTMTCITNYSSVIPKGRKLMFYLTMQSTHFI